MSDPQPPQPPYSDDPNAPTSHEPPTAGYAPPTPPQVPPTAVGYAPPPPKTTTWPTVVGVISIVWGAFYTLGGLCGIGTMLFWEQYIAWISNITLAGDPNIEAMKRADMDNPISLLLGAVGLLLAIFLIMAGAKVLKRRRQGVAWSRLYAVINLPLMFISMIVSYWLQREMYTSSYAGMPGEEAIAIASMFCGVLLAAIWPVFLLIWFARAKVKEEVAKWPE